MTDHLPECEYEEGPNYTKGVCICQELRACEARVENEQMDHMRSHRDEWIADGVQAAYDAVAAWFDDRPDLVMYEPDRDDGNEWRPQVFHDGDKVLAAIDAVKRRNE